MRRRLIAFLLLLCMSWQALACAGGTVAVAAEQELAHALLHFEGTGHHHDGHDGDVHLDDSAASLSHATTDACLMAPGLLSATRLPLLSLDGAAPAGPIAAEPPLPFLRGPERPPRARA